MQPAGKADAVIAAQIFFIGKVIIGVLRGIADLEDGGFLGAGKEIGHAVLVARGHFSLAVFIVHAQDGIALLHHAQRHIQEFAAGDALKMVVKGGLRSLGGAAGFQLIGGDIARRIAALHAHIIALIRQHRYLRVLFDAANLCCVLEGILQHIHLVFDGGGKALHRKILQQRRHLAAVNIHQLILHRHQQMIAVKSADGNGRVGLDRRQFQRAVVGRIKRLHILIGKDDIRLHAALLIIHRHKIRDEYIALLAVEGQVGIVLCYIGNPHALIGGQLIHQRGIGQGICAHAHRRAKEAFHRHRLFAVRIDVVNLFVILHMNIALLALIHSMRIFIIDGREAQQRAFGHIHHGRRIGLGLGTQPARILKIRKERSFFLGRHRRQQGCHQAHKAQQRKRSFQHSRISYPIISHDKL